MSASTALASFSFFRDLADALRDGPAAHPEAFGPYRVLRWIGDGGCGRVYLCRDDHLNRLVAVKVLDSAIAAEWLRWEGRTQAQLKHPNIVHIQGFMRDGDAFLVAEYVAGGSLRAWLDGRAGRPTDPAAVARFVRQVAAALGHAHGRGVIHADVKPANILLDGDDGQAAEPLFPHVTDFGFAQVVDPATGLVVGMVGGTAEYMSPEQAARYDAHRQAAAVVSLDPSSEAATVPSPDGVPGLTFATDVWSLGVVLYEMLTGARPYHGETRDATVELVKAATPQPVAAARPDVPADLAAICDKCLSRDPAKRYATGDELAADLDRYLAGQPVTARPTGPADRAWRWARRNRAVAALSAVALLALLVVLGLAFYLTATLAGARAERLLSLRMQAREEALHRRPGWTWRALDHLAVAAPLSTAPDHHAGLRSEAIAALGAIDVRELPPIELGAPSLYSLAWSPDGRWLAVGRRHDGKEKQPCHVLLVDPTGERSARALTAAAHPIVVHRVDVFLSVAFSPDGRWLAGGTRSGHVHVWDLNQKNPEPTSLRTGLEPVDQVAFSPEGRSLFACFRQGLGGLISRWTVGAWAEPPTTADRCAAFAIHPQEGWLACHRPEELEPSPVYNAALTGEIRLPRPIAELPFFSPDGTWLATRGGPHEVVLRDARSWEPIRRLEADKDFMPGMISDLAIDPTGQLILTATKQPAMVGLWSVIDGALVATLRLRPGTIRVAFAPDGGSFAAVGEHEIQRFEIRRPAVREMVAVGPGEVRAFAWRRDGKEFAYARKRAEGKEVLFGGDIATWPYPPRDDRAEVVVTPNGSINHPGESRLTYSDDRLVYGYAHADSWPLILHDPAGRQSERSCNVHGPGDTVVTSQVEGDPDGNLWVVCAKEFRVYSPALERLGSWFNDDGERLHGIPEVYALAAGRKYVVGAYRDGNVRVFPRRPERLAPEAVTKVAPVPLTAVAVNADETLAVLADENHRFHVVALPGGETRHSTEPHPDGAGPVAWGAGDVYATADRAGGVAVWRWTPGKPSLVFEARHRRPVRELRFSPDGTALGVRLDGEFGLHFWRLDRVGPALEAVGLGDGLAEILPGPPAREAAPRTRVAGPPSAPARGVLAEFFTDPAMRRRHSALHLATLDLFQDLFPEECTHGAGRFTGVLRVPATARYHLRAHSRPGLPFRLWLDDQLVIDDPRTGMDPDGGCTFLPLAAGDHRLRVECQFRDTHDIFHQFRLIWKREGAGWVAVTRSDFQPLPSRMAQKP